MLAQRFDIGIPIRRSVPVALEFVHPDDQQLVLDAFAAAMEQGQSYELNVSLQNHKTNPAAVTLAGKRITIVEGTGKTGTEKGKGQT